MRHWKWFIVILFFLIAIFFLPQILSTSIGRRFIIRSIESKTHTTATVKEIHLSWLGPQRITQLEMQSPEFKGNIESIQIGAPLWVIDDLTKHLDRINGDFRLENGSFQFLPDVEIVGTEAHFRLHQGSADFTASGSAMQGSQEGSISLQGQIRQFNNPEFSVHGSLSSFPTLPIARVLSDLLDEQTFIQIIGPTVNLDASASNQTIDLALHSPNVDGEFHGNIADKTITMRQALTATFRLTPELSDVFLRDINPLFITGIQAKNPVRLRIESRNFRINLPLDLQSIQIGQGTLEMNQIVCRNGEFLGTIISLLKNRFLSGTPEMTIWFSPLSFRLQNGLLQTERMDALIADTIRICTWGNIDLNRDKLDMNLGLTAETLKDAFGIKKLPDNYVLKVPLTGSTKNPKLAIPAAVAKIAALVAAQNVPTGKLPSGLLNIFTQPETDIPPP